MSEWFLNNSRDCESCENILVQRSSNDNNCMNTTNVEIVNNEEGVLPLSLQSKVNVGVAAATTATSESESRKVSSHAKENHEPFLLEEEGSNSNSLYKISSRNVSESTNKYIEQTHEELSEHQPNYKIGDEERENELNDTENIYNVVDDERSYSVFDPVSSTSLHEEHISALHSTYEEPHKCLRNIFTPFAMYNRNGKKRSENACDIKSGNVNDTRSSINNNNNNNNSNEHEEEEIDSKEESEKADAGLDHVLEDAAQIRGLRLSWIMLIMVGLILSIIALLLSQMSYSARASLQEAGSQAVQSKASIFVNNIEMLKKELAEMLTFVDENTPWSMSNRSREELILYVTCSRLYSATVAVIHYSNVEMWSVYCDATKPSKLPTGLPYNYEKHSLPLQIVTPSNDNKTLIAYLNQFASSKTEAYSVTGVVLDKAVIGRVLFSNNSSNYSYAELLNEYAAFVMPSWESGKPTLAFHTLTKEDNTYTVPQPTAIGERMMKSFGMLCLSNSKYRWDIIIEEEYKSVREAILINSQLQERRYLTYKMNNHRSNQINSSSSSNTQNENHFNSAPRTESEYNKTMEQYRFWNVEEENLSIPHRIAEQTITYNPFPPTYTEHRNEWSLLSRVSVCGVVCEENDNLEKCYDSNPSNVWIVIDRLYPHVNSFRAMFIAGSVGIAAVLVFLCIVLLGCISVTVPIRVLRLQLMQTVGSHKKPSRLLQFFSRFTRIFWLADISALIRAIRLLSLCYKLNKKYVPSHVLRSRARILLQTKKSHVLDDIFDYSNAPNCPGTKSKDWKDNNNIEHDDMNDLDNDNDDMDLYHNHHLDIINEHENEKRESSSINVDIDEGEWTEVELGESNVRNTTTQHYPYQNEDNDDNKRKDNSYVNIDNSKSILYFVNHTHNNNNHHDNPLHKTTTHVGITDHDQYEFECHNEDNDEDDDANDDEMNVIGEYEDENETVNDLIKLRTHLNNKEINVNGEPQSVFDKSDNNKLGTHRNNSKLMTAIGLGKNKNKNSKWKNTLNRKEKTRKIQQPAISSSPSPAPAVSTTTTNEFISISHHHLLGPLMSVRYTDEATLMYIHIAEVDRAYVVNTNVTIHPHLQLMRVILRCIRRYKGNVFYCAGDVVAAAWNAFESCSNHCEWAALCAQQITHSLASHRSHGLKCGIVLHQGTFVCGTIEMTDEAYTTAFGEANRHALLLAELASMLNCFNVLLTEPVKQCLSSTYECNVVDVVQYSEFAHLLILFELGPRREHIPTTNIQFTSINTTINNNNNNVSSHSNTNTEKDSSSHNKSPLTPVGSQFTIEYAKVFSLFRNHEFSNTLHGIHTIRSTLPCISSHLLDRLERLCQYYMLHSSELPMPYYRPLPCWTNYEHIASSSSSSSFSPPWNVRRCINNNNNNSNNNAKPLMYKVAGPDVSFTKTNLNKYGNKNNNNKNKMKDLNINYNNNNNNNNNGGSSKVKGDKHAVSKEIVVRRTNKSKPLENSTENESKPEAAVISVAAQEMMPNQPENLEKLGWNEFPRFMPYIKSSLYGLDEMGSFKRELHAKVKELGTPWRSPLAQALTDAENFIPLTSSIHSTKEKTNYGKEIDKGNSAVLEENSVNSTNNDANAINVNVQNETNQSKNSDSTEANTTSPETEHSGQKEKSTFSTFKASSESTREETEKMLSSCKEESLSEKEKSSKCKTSESSCFTENRNSVIQSMALSFYDGKNTFNNNNNKNNYNDNSYSANGNVSCCYCPHRDGCVIDNMGGNNNNNNNNVNVNMTVTRSLPTEINAKNGTLYLRSARMLGRGSFGTVYLGMDSYSGKLVAIKFLPLPDDEKELESIEAEVMIMQRVKDPHVVEFITYAFLDDMIVFIMECMMAGSLQRIINEFSALPSATARVFIRDVLRGLHKLHSIDVIHRDVKPQNVLLSLSGTCKISDFGTSAWIQQLARHEYQGQVTGTPAYLAPEAARGLSVKESDIWSCGIVFVESLTGKLPYSPEQLRLPVPIFVFQLGSGTILPDIPTSLNELDAAFVHCCLQIDPSMRKTAAELLQMPLFTV